MKCQNCHARSYYIKVLANGEERCPRCGGFSEASGVKTSGLLTRSSFRVRTEAVKYEGDTITPFVYNHAEKKMDLNQEFVKLYPNQAKDYYTDVEMRKAHLPKLAERAQNIRTAEKKHKEDLRGSVEFVGDQQKAMERMGLGA